VIIDLEGQAGSQSDHSNQVERWPVARRSGGHRDVGQDVSTELQRQDAARVSPKFDLQAGAHFLTWGRRSQQTAMGAKIIGFILYLALSYGVIFALISKRFRSGWNIGEQRVRAAVLIAMAVIIAVGTMLVGPLPMVLLVVALVAFIDYIRSSETLAATATDSTPDWRLLPSLIGTIGWLKRELTIASAHRGVDRVRLLAPSLLGSIPSLKRILATASAYHGIDRHLAPSLLRSIASLNGMMATASAYHGVDRIRSLVFPAARSALATGVARLSGHVCSLTRKPARDSHLNACNADQPPAAPAPPDKVQPPPPPLPLAEGHGLYAVRAALAPPKPAGRMPTRDEARRLLDHLEGRAFEALNPDHQNTNQVRDNAARSLSDMGHADEALGHSQAAEASHKQVLGPDHCYSKDSAGLSTRGQCVVEGNEGPPLPPPTRSTTTKEVGNETKGIRILARSKLEKVQQPSLELTPNPPLAKAEVTEIQRKFEEVWTLYARRGKSEAQALSASSSSRVGAAAPWRPTPGTAPR
jgi:hypothetical protein